MRKNLKQEKMLPFCVAILMLMVFFSGCSLDETAVVNNQEYVDSAVPEAEINNQESSKAVRYRYLNISKIKQERSNWCWLACSEIVIEYVKGYDVDQSYLCQKIKGSIVNEGGDPSKCLQYYGVRFSQDQNPLAYYQGIVDDIDNNQPIIADIIIEKASGNLKHAVVIYGYYYTNSEKWVRVWDPDEFCGTWYRYEDFIDNNTQNFYWWQTRWNIR